MSASDKPIDFNINPQSFTGSADQLLDNPAGFATTALTPAVTAIGVFATAVISIKLIQAIISSLQK
ncbi:hypothetical protein VKI21_02290 [Cyanobacterium aponinum UTEX 3222]|uniref:hypothetical protein n=1 Tax=Cyanobacterium aponinum TaxID=379064 RepID=UPI00308EB520|nr:hypothetical protein VKI21_02290 [Cyanobacterium aponinum UTEX 3222]